MNAEVNKMYEQLHTKLHNVVPDVELRIKAELAVEINHLKKERNADIGSQLYGTSLVPFDPRFCG